MSETRVDHATWPGDLVREVAECVAVAEHESCGPRYDVVGSLVALIAERDALLALSAPPSGAAAIGSGLLGDDDEQRVRRALLRRPLMIDGVPVTWLVQQIDELRLTVPALRSSGDAERDKAVMALGEVRAARLDKINESLRWQDRAIEERWRWQQNFDLSDEDAIYLTAAAASRFPTGPKDTNENP